MKWNKKKKKNKSELNWTRIEQEYKRPKSGQNDKDMWKCTKILFCLFT